MSGFDFGAVGLPVPVDVAVADGRFVLTLSDGSTRVSGPFPAFDTSSIQGTVDRLQAAIDAHTASISTNVDAIAALQVASHADEAHLATLDAAIAAIDAKISADEATVASLKATLDSLVAAKTADEALLAVLQADVSGLKSSRTTDEAAIAANAAAIAALRGSQATDEATIAANGAAIAALQAAKATDEAAIASNGVAIANLQTRQSSDETRLTNLEGRPAVPAASAATKGLPLLSQGDGTVAFGALAAGGGVETYISTVLVKASTNSFNFAAAVPTSAKGNKATIAVHRAGGGGGGGYAMDANDNNAKAPGGAPGQVSIKRTAVSSVPASYAVTVGRGGQGQGKTGGACLAGAGQDTIVPALGLAGLGGPGGFLFAGFAPAAQIQGDVPSGRPGQGIGNQNTVAQFGTADASHGDGPGAGGGCLANQTDGYAYGGNGGDSCVNNPALRLAGGNGRANNGSLDRNGKDHTDPRGYGSGGGGAPFFNGTPGNGGFPCGGGGGGGAGSNGGDGVYAIDFYVVE